MPQSTAAALGSWSTSSEDAVCGWRLTLQLPDLGWSAIGAAVPRESPLPPGGTGRQRARLPIERDEHAGLEGPFTLIETHEGQRIAYVEAYKDSRLYTERRQVREIEEQYGILRAQALTPRESLAFVEKLLGER